MPLRRANLAWMLSALLGAFLWMGRAEANPYLHQAKADYENVRYEDCVRRLQQAQLWQNTSSERLELELYAGLCQFALRHVPEARAHFSLALRLDATAQLPPLSPPKAIALFKEVAQELERAAPKVSSPDGRLPHAPETPLVLAPRVPPHPRHPAEPERSTLRATLPWVFAGAAVAAGVGGSLILLRAKDAERRANAEPYQAPAVALGATARARARSSYVLFGVAAGAGAGVLLTF